MSGHGISNAVRRNLYGWFPPTVRDKVKKALNSNSTHTYYTNEDSWKRIARRKHVTGYEREFQYKDDSRVTLIVHSPPNDFTIDGYIIKVDGKVVEAAIASIVSDLAPKGTKAPKHAPAVFKPLTPQEMNKIELQVKYGDPFALLDAERE